MTEEPRGRALKDLFDLSGQVALVTGGSRGLGLQICEALGEYGAKVLLVARKADELEAAVVGLRAQGIDAAAYPADLAKPETAVALVEQVMADHGRLDILVNNAGATWGAAAEDHPLDGWNKVLNLNLTSVFLLCQAAAKIAMIPQGRGRIVNMASIEGFKAHHPSMMGAIGYSTSKGGLINMTRGLAAEWGAHGVTVNAIAPGYFPSKMTAVTIGRHEARLLDQTPLGKLGGPDDIKGIALLLASAAGGHITGQTVPVDGGASIL